MEPSSPVPLELRPLGLGELMLQAARLWRARFGPLFALSLGFHLLGDALGQGYAWVAQHRFPTLVSGVLGGGWLRSGRGALPREELLAFGVSTTALLLLSGWVSWVAFTVLSRYTLPQLLGQTVGAREALRQTLGRLGAVTGTYLLSLLTLLGVVALGMVPAVGLVVPLAGWVAEGGARLLQALGLAGAMVLLAVGTVAAVHWAVLRFLFTPAVLAGEQLGVWATCSRSGHLMSGRLGPGARDTVRVRATLVLSVASVGLVVLLVLAAVPATFLQLVYGGGVLALDGGAVPVLYRAGAGLLQAVMEAAFTPLLVVLVAQLYVDVRVRREALGRMPPSI